ANRTEHRGNLLILPTILFGPPTQSHPRIVVSLDGLHDLKEEKAPMELSLCTQPITGMLHQSSEVGTVVQPRQGAVGKETSGVLRWHPFSDQPVVSILNRDEALLPYIP